MKRGTDLKTKFAMLKARLGLRTYEVKGLLQALWDMTTENAPLGDIGRFTDEEIAAGIEWPLERAEELVQALVYTHWLDEHDGHRLVVHDWHEHCEEWLRKRLERMGIEAFATGPIRKAQPPPADNGEKRLPPAAYPKALGPSPKASEKKEKTAPPKRRTRAPNGLTQGEIFRLHAWLEGHKDKRLRRHLPHLDALIESCLGWHRGRGTLAANWYATVQTWIRKEKLPDARPSERPYKPPEPEAGSKVLSREEVSERLEGMLDRSTRSMPEAT